MHKRQAVLYIAAGKAADYCERERLEERIAAANQQGASLLVCDSRQQDSAAMGQSFAQQVD
jgi:hypothetical protein